MPELRDAVEVQRAAPPTRGYSMTAWRDCPTCGCVHAGAQAECSTCRQRAYREKLARNAAHETPPTAVQLIALWHARDKRYQTRRRFGFHEPITREEQAAIAAWRGGEVRELPVHEQAAAWIAFKTA